MNGFIMLLGSGYLLCWVWFNVVLLENA